MTEAFAARIGSLVALLKEPPSAMESRRRSYQLYSSSPYERNQIFVKNFEKLEEDPADFAPAPLEEDASVLPQDVGCSLGCVGPNVVVRSLPEGVQFVDARSEGIPITTFSTSETEDKMLYLNEAMRNALQRLRVEVGSSPKVPIIRLTASPGGKVFTHRRTEIVVGRASTAVFMDRLSDPSRPFAQPSLLSDVMDVVLERDAQLTFVTLSASNRDRVIHDAKFTLEDGAKLTYVSWYSNSSYVRCRTHVFLKGEGSSVDLYWGGYPKVASRYDFFAAVEHLARSTRGHALQRGLVKGRSRLLLKGMMTIRETAVNSDSHLSQHALLLTRESFANAIPGLEIQTNELKAKHAASISQPDEDQLFYLMSRGLTREEALMNVSLGYLSPLSANIPEGAAREALEEEMLKALQD